LIIQQAKQIVKAIVLIANAIWLCRVVKGGEFPLSIVYSLRFREHTPGSTTPERLCSMTSRAGAVEPTGVNL
jgi:hypothetical protein